MNLMHHWDGIFGRLSSSAAAIALAIWLVAGQWSLRTSQADDSLGYPDTAAPAAYGQLADSSAYQTTDVVFQSSEEEVVHDRQDERVRAAARDTLSYDGNMTPAGCSRPSCRCHGSVYPTWMWEWGCGGSPYRTGPGECDNWKVGPVWNVAVDGMVLFREDARLGALEDATDEDSEGNALTPLIREQFDYGAGGRVYATGWMPECAGYDLQFGYMGVEEWNASIIYPKVQPDAVNFPDRDETRTVYYRSSLHSAEFNFMRKQISVWRPYWGVRYVLFDDDIRDVINQEAPPPLDGDPPGADVTTTDMLMAVDIKNHLVGPQVGLRYDIWDYHRWLTLQGFANAGLYYQKIKRTDRMKTTTTVIGADDTGTADSEAFTSVATSSTTTTTELSDVAFLGEVSLTAVCRLNRCLALRGGYQLLWVDGFGLAEDAFLNTGIETQSMTFHGWHAGIEYRR